MATEQISTSIDLDHEGALQLRIWGTVGGFRLMSPEKTVAFLFDEVMRLRDENERLLAALDQVRTGEG